AVTILAQKSDLQFLLITIYGTVAESRIRDFLRELGAFDAIRFDGGGSTQMVYETDLVKNVPPQLEWTEKPLANEEIEEESLGYLIVEASSLEYHDKPELREEPEKTEKAAKPEEKKDTKDSAESKEEGEESEAPSVATYGERYQVYEMKEAEDSTWYRIGESIWILASKDEVQYFGNDEIEKSRAISDQETYQIRIKARNLQARKAPSADAAVIATTREGSVYTVFETTEDAAYTWYRIGKKHWIAALPGWIERTDEGIQADGVFDNEAEEEAEEEQPAGETAPADVPGEIPAEFVVEPYEVPQEAVTE
ncbi:MAG: phosphodiester glycosidase family protein, partial [Oscillospiraceae bacterium]|nr:phosphodiester glycosidase family protein [Oscillospiraceae bacterium]